MGISKERGWTLSYLRQIPSNIQTKRMILARFSNELLEAKCGVVWETTISESFSPKGIHTIDLLRAHEQEWWQNESL